MANTKFISIRLTVFPRDNGFFFDSVTQIPLEAQWDEAVQLRIEWHLDPDSQVNKPITFVVWPTSSPQLTCTSPCDVSPCNATFRTLPPSDYYYIGANGARGAWLGSFTSHFRVQTSAVSASTMTPARESSSSISTINATSTLSTISSSPHSNSSVATTESTPTTTIIIPSHPGEALLPTISSSAFTQTVNTPDTTPTNRDSGVNTSKTSSSRASIIGPIIAGMALVAILILALICFCRRHRGQQRTVFNRNMIIKQPQDQNVEIEMSNRPDSDYMSACSESVIALNTGITTTGKVDVWTERQKEIEGRMQHLVALLDTLESQPQTDSEASITKVRERIKRLSALKEGDWAREVSDIKPLEMI